MFQLLRYAHATKLSYIGGEGVHGGQGIFLSRLSVFVHHGMTCTAADTCHIVTPDRRWRASWEACHACPVCVLGTSDNSTREQTGSNDIIYSDYDYSERLGVKSGMADEENPDWKTGELWVSDSGTKLCCRSLNTML